MISKIFRIFYLLVKNLFEKNDQLEDINFIELNRNLIQEKTIIPKKIWLYWEDDQIPDLVKLCYESIEKHCQEYEVKLLNASNVKDYINLPKLSDQIPLAQKADLIRLELLVKFGGIWMDASIFLTRNLDWILSKIDDHDAFLFYSDECTTDIAHPISENWFIASPIDSQFIKDWRDEFKSCITSTDPKNYYNSIKFDKKIVQNLTAPDYLLAYISVIVCLRKNKYKILYVASGSLGHYYNYKYNWSGYAVACHLLFRSKKNIYNPYLIKFASNSRKPIETLMNFGLYNRKSILLDSD